MVAGIVIVGIGARIIVDAVKHGRAQQPATQTSEAAPPAEKGFRVGRTRQQRPNPIFHPLG
jgi:hypothetical protein